MPTEIIYRYCDDRRVIRSGNSIRTEVVAGSERQWVEPSDVGARALLVEAIINIADGLGITDDVIHADERVEVRRKGNDLSLTFSDGVIPALIDEVKELERITVQLHNRKVGRQNMSALKATDIVL